MIPRSDSGRSPRVRSGFDGGLHSDLLFEGTGLVLTVDALIVLGALRAAGAGSEAWLHYLANMGSPVGRAASGVLLVSTLAFSLRWLLGSPVDRSAPSLAGAPQGGRVPGLERLEAALEWLFRIGGSVAAWALPALMFALTLAAPLGWLSAAGSEGARGAALRSWLESPAVQLVCAGVVSLTLWHAAHHLRLFMLDLGLSRIRTPVAYLLYGMALGGTALASLQVLWTLATGG
ncbi:MAG: hypothetical protein ACE5IL_08430 [Myxococcota bacterium]